MVSNEFQIKSEVYARRATAMMARVLLIVGLMGLGAACSMNDDLGTTLAVPANFPKFSDMPAPPTTALSPAEVTALRLELENTAATHEQARTESIVGR